MHDPVKLAVHKLIKLLPELQEIDILYNCNFDCYDEDYDRIELLSYNDYQQELDENNINYHEILPIKQLIINHFNEFNMELYLYMSILHEYGHYYVYHYRRDIYDLDTELRDNYDLINHTPEKYRELPTEKFADEFALNLIKQEYNKLFSLKSPHSHDSSTKGGIICETLIKLLRLNSKNPVKN